MTLSDHRRRQAATPRSCSHCKPWRDSNNEERLDGENGLLLTPSIDHLFDKGFIGFEDSGRLIISPVAHRPSLQKMGVETQKPVTVGDSTSGQKYFLNRGRYRFRDPPRLFIFPSGSNEGKRCLRERNVEGYRSRHKAMPVIILYAGRVEQMAQYIN